MLEASPSADTATFRRAAPAAPPGRACSIALSTSRTRVLSGSAAKENREGA